MTWSFSPKSSQKTSHSSPLGWDMGCLLCFHILIYISPQSLQWCVQYNGILDYFITAPDYVWIYLEFTWMDSEYLIYNIPYMLFFYVMYQIFRIYLNMYKIYIYIYVASRINLHTAMHEYICNWRLMHNAITAVPNKCGVAWKQFSPK